MALRGSLWTPGASLFTVLPFHIGLEFSIIKTLSEKIQREGKSDSEGRLRKGWRAVPACCM